MAAKKEQINNIHNSDFQITMVQECRFEIFGCRAPKVGNLLEIL